MIGALAVAGGLLSMGGTIFGGVSQYRSSRDQSDEILNEGRILYQESLRDAAIVREEGDAFAAKQSLEFIGAGFELGGSALIITNQAGKYSETEAEAIEARGRAQMVKAERTASRTRSTGKASLISSIMSSVGTGLPMFGGKKK